MSIEVLLVDEDRDVLEIVGTFLGKEADFEVTTESDPVTARDEVFNGEYDAVVSDYKMPQLNGVELCEELREQGESIPFLLFSARERVDLEDELEAAGVTEFVQKGTGTDQYSRLANHIRDAI